jgi:uracil-DNA glycosylase family 4
MGSSSRLSKAERPGPARLAEVARDIVACEKCARLVSWRTKVAREKRAAYRDQDYWGRPVPGFGDPRARIVFVGLAPGAHGANRTGRIFTGDRSGDFLYAALHRAGLASQAEAIAKDDGLTLRGAFVTCPVRCAPPDNKPTPEEIVSCSPFLDRELDALLCVRVLVALGSIGWTACLGYLGRRGEEVPRPRPGFAHGAEVPMGRYVVVGSFHVSQQNTQTGRLTPRMFDEVLNRAIQLAGPSSDVPPGPRQ